MFSQVTRLTNSEERKMLLKGKSMCPKARVPVPVMQLLLRRDISYGQIRELCSRVGSSSASSSGDPGLNLNPETYYPYIEFSLFSSARPGTCRKST